MGLKQSSTGGHIKSKILLALIVFLSCSLLACISVVTAWYIEQPGARVVLQTPVTISILQTSPRSGLATPSPFLERLATNSSHPASMKDSFTPTNTRVVIPQIDQKATDRAIKRATSEANNRAEVMAQLNSLSVEPRKVTAGSPISYLQSSRLVLAHYFAWYDGDGWNNCNISAGDKPVQPYDSDDSAAIARHIKVARQIGLNGFTLHWFAPGDRTDRNFGTVLTLAKGSDFAASVVFSRHIYHGIPATGQNIAEALRYIIDHHGRHPNFLRMDQKPVIFFTDVYRTPRGSQQSPQQFWAVMRAQVDPENQSWWIAEGLDASYLTVFDGLYVFKISHAAYPHDYVKSSRWGRQVRAMARQTGQPKLWLGTISPGWDDRRSVCRADVRVANTPHRLDRAEGTIYEATFQAAIASQPDWLMVSSFNEWVEGSYIEPSEQYGDKYLRLTKEFVERFKSR